jgi:hypothetical protein
MPIEKNPADEIAIFDKIKNRLKDLHDRMDLTFGYFRGDEFKIPSDEGEWDSVTSNRAQAEGWKLNNLLSTARISIFSPLADEDKSDREMVANTEKVVKGLLYSADMRRDSIPDNPTLQAETAFYPIVRGWIAERLLILNDDDEHIYLDDILFDPRNTFWVAGNGRLYKVYIASKQTEQEVKDTYKGWNGTVDEYGLVDVKIVMDCSEKGKPAQEAVIIGDEYVQEPTIMRVGKEPLDYLPVRIKAVGSTPYINDTRTDNIAHVGQDYLVNNRKLLDEDSRSLSYIKTAAGMEVKAPAVGEYDSTGGGEPPKMPSDPFVKDRFIWLDKAKGQTLLPNQFPQPRMEKSVLYNQKVEQALNTGGLSRVAFGEGDSAMTATGTDILNKNTREHIWPFEQAVKQAYVWRATEIIKQYKMGGFKEEEFKYYRSKHDMSCVKLKPELVLEGRMFECSIIIDALRDRATQSGMAIQETKAKIMSRREALEVHQLSDDPDNTINQLRDESADELLGIGAVEALGARLKDYLTSADKDPIKKMVIELAFKNLQMIQNPPEAQVPQGAEQVVGQNPNLAAAGKRPMTARMPQASYPGNTAR